MHSQEPDISAESRGLNLARLSEGLDGGSGDGANAWVCSVGRRPEKTTEKRPLSRAHHMLADFGQRIEHWVRSRSGTAGGVK